MSSTRRRSSWRCATRGLPTRWRRRRRARARAPAHRLLGPTRRTLEDLMAQARLRAFHRLRHRERRRLPDRIHLGHDRRAERHDAFPPRHAGELRQLSPNTCCSRPRRPLHRLAAARLHLRARRPCAVPAPHRRGDRCCSRRRRRTNCCRRSRRYRATICFTAPTAYRAMLPHLARARHLLAAQVRLRRRGAAEGDVRGLARGDRHARSSTASARPRCCTSSSARRRTKSAPARPARPCPATRRK